MSDLCEFAKEELDFYKRGRLLSRIARKAGVDSQTVTRCANGENIQVDTVEKIIDALGYDIILRRRK